MLTISRKDQSKPTKSTGPKEATYYCYYYYYYMRDFAGKWTAR